MINRFGADTLLRVVTIVNYNEVVTLTLVFIVYVLELDWK